MRKLSFRKKFSKTFFEIFRKKFSNPPERRKNFSGRDFLTFCLHCIGGGFCDVLTEPTLVWIKIAYQKPNSLVTAGHPGLGFLKCTRLCDGAGGGRGVAGGEKLNP